MRPCSQLESVDGAEVTRRSMFLRDRESDERTHRAWALQKAPLERQSDLFDRFELGVDGACCRFCARKQKQLQER
jgi:hypothetical protein